MKSTEYRAMIATLIGIAVLVCTLIHCYNSEFDEMESYYIKEVKYLKSEIVKRDLINHANINNHMKDSMMFDSYRRNHK